MNNYSIAKQIRKELKKWTDEQTTDMTIKEKIEFLKSDDYQELYKLEYENHLREFEIIANIEIDIRERYKKVCEERGYQNQDKLLMDTNKEPKIKHCYTLDISPPPSTPIEVLGDITYEIFNTLDLKDCEIAFEQRGHNDETKFSGAHIHSVIITKNTETLQKVKEKAKPILEKHKLKSNIIDFGILSNEHYKNKKEYIRGIKKGVDKDGIDKMLKVPYDKLMRENLGIPDIITTETLDILKKFKTDPTGGVSKPITPPVKITNSNYIIHM